MADASRCFVGVWDGVAKTIVVIRPDDPSMALKYATRWKRQRGTIYECSVGHAKKVLCEPWVPENAR